MQDTRTPVKVAAIALAANIIFSFILMKPLKHSGLALANALASGVNFTLLFFFLHRKLKKVDTKRIFRSFIRAIFASSIMGVIAGMLLHGKLWHIQGSILNKVFYMGGTITICIVVYLFFSYLIKSEEISYLTELFRQKFRKMAKD